MTNEIRTAKLNDLINDRDEAYVAYTAAKNAIPADAEALPESVTTALAKYNKLSMLVNAGTVILDGYNSDEESISALLKMRYYGKTKLTISAENGLVESVNSERMDILAILDYYDMEGAAMFGLCAESLRQLIAVSVAVENGVDNLVVKVKKEWEEKGIEEIARQYIKVQEGTKGVNPLSNNRKVAVIRTTIQSILPNSAYGVKPIDFKNLATLATRRNKNATFGVLIAKKKDMVDIFADYLHNQMVGSGRFSVTLGKLGKAKADVIPTEAEAPAKEAKPAKKTGKKISK